MIPASLRFDCLKVWNTTIQSQCGCVPPVPAFLMVLTHHACLLQDILHLYLFALVLQCLIFIPYMIKASQHAQTAKQVFYRLMDVLIFAVPPGLPLVLMLVGAVAQSVLLKAGVLLLRPEIVRPGAVIDMVCFDKTGTLTSNMVSEPVKYRPPAPCEQCFDLCEVAAD